MMEAETEETTEAPLQTNVRTESGKERVVEWEPAALAVILGHYWRWFEDLPRKTIVLVHVDGLWAEANPETVFECSQVEAVLIGGALKLAVDAGLTGSVMLGMRRDDEAGTLTAWTERSHKPSWTGPEFVVEIEGTVKPGEETSAEAITSIDEIAGAVGHQGRRDHGERRVLVSGRANRAVQRDAASHVKTGCHVAGTLRRARAARQARVRGTRFADWVPSRMFNGCLREAGRFRYCGL